MRVLCIKCERFLFETDSTVILKDLKCSGCKTKQNIKIVDSKSTKEQREYKFVAKDSTKV